MMNPSDQSLAHTVGFDLLGEELGSDLESAIQAALAGGAVFLGASTPLVIFRETLSASIRDIESDRRGQLFQEFLTKGPYENGGKSPLMNEGIK
ncbi:MAG: hypothetical protein NTZ17_03255 [Phycisphaerae bacterium]|nr:hypothetical protein [Phycisphaerae bacterium]